MSKELVERYAEVWARHGKIDGTPDGRANLEQLLEFYPETVAYADLPSGQTWTGHAGVTQMSEFVSNAFGPTLTVTSLVTDGGRFAFEFTMESAASPAVGKAVAVGTVVDGKIATHSDYYDLNSIMGGPPPGPPPGAGGPPPGAGGPPPVA